MADTHQNQSAYTLTNSDLAILPFIDFDEGHFLFPGNEHTSPEFTAASSTMMLPPPTMMLRAPGLTSS